jgi:hypothetical protein
MHPTAGVRWNFSVTSGEEAHLQPGDRLNQRQPIHAGRSQTSATFVATFVMA